VDCRAESVSVKRSSPNFNRLNYGGVILPLSALSAAVLGDLRGLSLCFPAAWPKTLKCRGCGEPRDAVQLCCQPNRSNLLTKCVDGKLGLTPYPEAQGKPTQNAHVESFHGRLREECLNGVLVSKSVRRSAQDRGVALENSALPEKIRPSSACGPPLLMPQRLNGIKS
jgi:hypothetical protein